jgi:MoxR-like ATPase
MCVTKPLHENENVRAAPRARDRIDAELSKVGRAGRDRAVAVRAVLRRHCLITGAPGLAKTLLVALDRARCFHLKFQRISSPPT